MSLPAVVQNYLDRHHLEYSITTGPADIPDAVIVRLLLLEDTLGPVQVLIPEYGMLQLTPLCESLGRNLVAMDPQKARQMWLDYGLQCAAGLPSLTELHTLVDRSLFGHEYLMLDAGNPGLRLRISKEEFAQLTEASEIIDCVADTRSLSAEWLADEPTIHAAVESFTSLRIKQRLIDTLEIPPLPDTARKIIRLRVDPEASVDDLAAIIEQDPPLTAQVICWASSPYYAAPGAITTVREAIMRVLGFDLVLNMALGLALGKTLALPKDGPHGISTYWKEAAFTATGMQALSNALPRKLRRGGNIGYLSGLLHNFGFLLLGHIFPPHFSLVMRHVEANPHLEHHMIERMLLGISREQIAGWLLHVWNMPQEVVEAIRHQHDPDYSGSMAFHANLLFICHHLLREQGVIEGPLTDVPEEMWEAMKLPEEEAREAIAALVSERRNDIETLARQISG